MIRSLRGLVGLGAVIAVLALAAVLGRGGRAAPTHALVARFDPTTATLLVWTYGDRTQVQLVRAGAVWKFPTDPTPDGALVDATALDAVIAALRGGTWHRERSAGLATPAALQTTLAVTTPSGIVTLHLAPVEGADSPVAGQTWLTVGAHTVLVDNWIVRSLAPTALALTNRTPFAQVAAAAGVTVRNVLNTQIVATVRLAGSPLGLVEPAAVRAVPEYLATLPRALAALEVAAFAKPVTTTRPLVAIAIDVERTTGAHVVASIHAACDTEPCPCAPGFRLLSGDAGDGCIASPPVEALVTAMSMLTADVRTLADPRPVDFAPVAVRYPDDSVVQLASRPTVVGPHGDPKAGELAAFDRVAELALVLATPAPVITVPAGPAAPLLRITGALGEVVALDLYPGSIVARHGEPVALQLGAGAVAILQRPAAAYIEIGWWRADPFAVQSIAITKPGAAAATVITRGQVIGEWTRDGKPLAVDLAAEADVAAAQLARPERNDAPATASAATRPTPSVYSVMLTVREPGGVTTHAFDVVATGAECALVAKAPATTLRVTPQLCEAIGYLAK